MDEDATPLPAPDMDAEPRPASEPTTSSSSSIAPPPPRPPPPRPPPNAALESPSLGASTPRKPDLSRNPSFSGSSSYHDELDSLPPLDRLGVLDLLDNLALPQQLEKLQRGLSAQTEKVRRSGEAFKSRTQLARDRMVEEWRRRAPSAEEQLDRYRKHMRQRVESLGRQWNDTKVISMREKISFIFGVMNIFVSAYLIGGHPTYFHLWYTVLLLYFMPIRFITYHRQGYHYFLADLCYFVNLLLSLSIWVFPGSKRLLLATYSLAFGNNAIAIIMWRNSLVFHSFDKVTSLFIHIMPCVTLHCIIHLFPADQQRARFPAIWTIKTSPPGSPTAYANILSMLGWSTIPYAVWQLTYYFFITVRRQDKIAAGRPTSFTWLRRSYSDTWIGRLILSLPEWAHEPAFMMTQYGYAVLTMLPCPVWFVSRYASSAFLLTVFSWSIYNGSTYYIDVFGKRFQKELEAMKAEVQKWHNVTDSPLMTPQQEPAALVSGPSHEQRARAGQHGGSDGDPKSCGAKAAPSVDHIPLLDDSTAASTTSIDTAARNSAHARRLKA